MKDLVNFINQFLWRQRPTFKMFVIGDKWTDIELGEKIGAKKILVETGYGKGELIDKKDSTIQPDIMTSNLLTAVYEILKVLKNG